MENSQRYAFHKILGSKEVIDDIYKKLDYILEKIKDLPDNNNNIIEQQTECLPEQPEQPQNQPDSS
jgi:hypothetical protein